MSLTTDLTEQKDIKYQTVTGVHWEISPSDRVEPVPDNTISIDFANGYTKGKFDMQKKIDAAIEEFRLIDAANVYKVWGYDEIVSVIRKHIGEAE